MRYGSVGVAVAVAHGRPVAMMSETVHVGTVPAGATVERTLRVVNLSAEPVQVALAESSCNCARVIGLPATVEVGATIELSVQVTVGDKVGEFRQSARLRTTVGELEFGITGRVEGHSDGAGIGLGRTPKEDVR